MIETMRHVAVIDLEHSTAKDTAIHVIGCGALGSRVALGLAKLGVSNMHLWDFDKIESHNIANQAYGILDVGRYKVEALAGLIARQTGLKTVPHPEKVVNQHLFGFIFLLPDSMESRREIWDESIKWKAVALFEGRMGVSEGRVYYVNPKDPVHISKWESTLCLDSEAEDSVCGSHIAVGPTAEFISALMQWQFIKYINSLEKPRKVENEIIAYVDPPLYLMNCWNNQ